MFKIPLLLLAIVMSGLPFPQNPTINRDRAKDAVSRYLEKMNPEYRPVDFGEFFKQHDPVRIEAALGTSGNVKYSLVHTFYLSEERFEDEYFHLDKECNVLGHLPKSKMMELSVEGLLLSKIFLEVLDTMNISPEELRKGAEHKAE